MMKFLLKPFVQINAIVKYSQFIYALYRLTKNETAQNVKFVNRTAKRCGPLAIKLLQCIVMGGHEEKNLIKTHELDFVLEDYYVHSLEETMKVDTFNDYILGDVVGSGSIGQVYKAFSKKRKEYVAIKVKHPGTDKLVQETVSAVKLVCYIFKCINKFHYIMMEYINNIHLQIDYIQEAKNTIKLNELYKNERCIIIPEIINYSDNFIIMSYHEGKSFKCISPREQLLASMYVNFFYMESLIIHDFLHADLHFGNWKVIGEGNELQVLIYDCGIVCSTGDLSINQEIMNNIFNRRNFIKILDIVKRVDPTNKKLKRFGYYRNKIENSIQYDNSSAECFTKFVHKVTEYRLFRDRNINNILNSIAVIGEAPSKSISVFTKYIQSTNYNQSTSSSNSVLFHIYCGFLEKIGKFTELKNYFLHDIASSPENAIIYNDWLFEEFGHRNGNILTNLIYQKFFD